MASCEICQQESAADDVLCLACREAITRLVRICRSEAVRSVPASPPAAATAELPAPAEPAPAAAFAANESALRRLRGASSDE